MGCVPRTDTCVTCGDHLMGHLSHVMGCICRTDTVRARIAAGLFERVAEWNGYGRALYPATSGVAANPNIDMSTTVALMVQAQLLGMRPQVFARRAEQFEYDDFDRCLTPHQQNQQQFLNLPVGSLMSPQMLGPRP